MSRRVLPTHSAGVLISMSECPPASSSWLINLGVTRRVAQRSAASSSGFTTSSAPQRARTRALMGRTAREMTRLTPRSFKMRVHKRLDSKSSPIQTIAASTLWMDCDWRACSSVQSRETARVT